MPLLAFAMVLLAACTHATWNYWAKRAAASRHIVWLYSVGSTILYSPIVAWIVIFDRPHFETAHWLALLATGVLHMAYSLLLQAGYRVSDLSLIYPIARGTGPLLSFIAATLFLGEPANALSVVGVVVIVGGILLVSGLASAPHKAPKAGVAFGILIGIFIASYTINDGWAVKALMISPFIIDGAGNILRIVLLAPMALREPAELARELREYRTSILVVSVLGPLGLHPGAVRDEDRADRARGAGARARNARRKLLRREAAEGENDPAASHRRRADRRWRHQPRGDAADLSALSGARCRWLPGNAPTERGSARR
ncbi:MAG: EamA family transporter [Gammaproteobacteria bacterium]